MLDRAPSAGAVATTSANETVGITEWTLSNGVRVVLKPTTFKQDEILFRAVSPGGMSLASDEDFISARTADAVIEQGGLGSFSRIDLDKVLAGTTASVRADINTTEEGLAGGAARKDLETMFQLIYLTFTAPRADPVAFKAMTDQLKVALANGQAQPEVLFNQALDAAVSQNHPRAQPLTARKRRSNEPRQIPGLLQGSLRRCQRLHLCLRRQLRSADDEAAGGEISRQSALERRKETVKDVGIRPPPGIVERQVKSGIAPRSEVSIVFTGPFQNDQQHRVIATAMTDTLAGNLQRTLREDLGGTYGVSVVPRYAKRPTPEYRITITFACDPARTDSLVKTAFQVIDTYKKLGPGQGQVTDTRATLLRDLETNIANNEYLLNQILFKYEFGEDVNEIYNMRPFYDQVTAAALRDAAQQYLNTTRYVEVRLLPDTR